MQLSNDAKLAQAIATTSAGVTTINGGEQDMQGYEGVLFIVKLGTAAADNNLKAQQDSATGMGSAQDLEGTKTGNGATDGILWLDIYKPRKRFVRCVALRGTSTTIDWGVAIRYTSRGKPVSNVLAGTIFGELHVSPAEGTP